MQRFLRTQLVRFLEAVDAALAGPATVVVIGGTAAAIQYGARTGTRDIDTWSAVDAELTAAVARARATTGLEIPFGKSGVADGPHDFESRLTRALPQLRRLTVLVPEKHDLVLMKTLRCYEHDIAAIAEIHAHSALDLDVLVRRFEDEMGSCVGDPTRLRGSFLVVVERLFPDSVEGVARRLKQGRPA